ncbi:MAG: S41 family peptidase [Phycisphaerae bacterium]
MKCAKQSVLIFSVVVLLGSATAVVQADNLSSAYAAILRGDVEGGLARVHALHENGADKGEIQRVESWLSKYTSVINERDELRKQSLQWNVDNAQKILADEQDENKLYLALTFAARAVSYTDDEKAYAAEPWIKSLSEKAKSQAEQYANDGEWTKAHAYYLALERIHGERSEYKEARDRAGEHLRVDILYEDKEALERRIAEVNPSLLYGALKQINDNYFEKPDFVKVSKGGLKAMKILAESKELAKFLDGLANPDARKVFEDKIERMIQQVRTREKLDWKDAAEMFRTVLEANDATVELPVGLLVVEYLEGALNELDDFTSMIWPVDAVDFDKMMLGGFEGVGIQLGIDEETSRLKVVTPLENSPSLEAGIQPDDLIVEVDGETTKGWTTDDAVRNIMGPAGSVVTLTMYRPATGQRIKFPLTRRNIVLKTVRGAERISGSRGDEWNYILDPVEKLAYIRLSGFHPDSADELMTALNQAKQQGMRGLILDLRYNPGGLLDVAVDTVSTFLAKGEVVSTRGRNREERQELDVTGRAILKDLPLVVLVNDGSASASEILAGALQDHERAMVIGSRTFGKGSVQRVFRLGPTRARLKLTTALYYLPDGRTPHRAPDDEMWGVEPDLAVKITPKEEREIIRRQNRMLVIRNGSESAETTINESDLKDLKDEPEDMKKVSEGEDESPLLTEADIELLNSDPHEATDADPQLEMALLQLRVKLAGNLPWPARIAAAGAAQGS